MMDNNPVLLKSSMFGGFNKKEVLSYIFELNENTQESQQKFVEQIEELSDSRDALRRTVDELESRLAVTQAGLDEIASRLDAETAKNLESGKLIEKLKAEIANREKDIMAKNEENLRLSSLNSGLADKNRQLEEKRGQVELAASQIAKLLGEAQDNADRIVQQARSEAAGITAESEKQAAKITAGAKAAANSYINDANKTINDIYARFGSFCKELGGLQEVISGVAAEMNSKMETLNGMTGKVMQTVPENLEFNETGLLNGEQGEPPVTEPIAESEPTVNVTEFANEVLGRYGVRKDDSGFFRLASDRNAK